MEDRDRIAMAGEEKEKRFLSFPVWGSAVVAVMYTGLYHFLFSFSLSCIAPQWCFAASCKQLDQFSSFLYQPLSVCKNKSALIRWLSS